MCEPSASKGAATMFLRLLRILGGWGACGWAHWQSIAAKTVANRSRNLHWLKRSSSRTLRQPFVLCYLRMKLLSCMLLLAALLCAQTLPNRVTRVLDRPLRTPDVVAHQLRQYPDRKVPHIPAPGGSAEWTADARSLRKPGTGPELPCCVSKQPGCAAR